MFACRSPNRRRSVAPARTARVRSPTCCGIRFTPAHYDGGLPTEEELAAEFFVSRNTIRDALAVLKNEGLIDRGRRVGTHVAVRKYDHGLDALVGLKETFKDYGEVRNEVRAIQHLSAPPAVARRLWLDPGEQVVFIERLRYLGELPLSLDLTYLAPDIGAEVFATRWKPTTCSRSSSRSPGSGSGRRRLRWRRSPPTALGGDAAGCPTARPLLMLERLTSLDDGRPVDLEYIRMRGDRITMRGSLSGAETMTLVNQRADVPVTIDESLCIEGCTLCVDICPLDSLAINPDNGKAYMHVDECWYCGPCAARCPTGAVTVNMPYLLR